MTLDHANEIEILPAARPAHNEAIGQLMAHAQAMTAAKQLGDALAGTDMVPADYKGKPGNAAAAILYGAELGLNPIQSLQQIFVVQGKPAIYARTAVALVKRHGILVETLSSTNDSVTVRATDPRTSQVEESTWDIGRAEQAKYTSNAKYKTDPQAMLYAKAAMEVCRKIAPDILLGIPYAREELDLEVAPQRVRSERVARGVDGLRAAIGNPVDDQPQRASENRPEPETQQVSRVGQVDDNTAGYDADDPSDEPGITRAQLQKLSILRQHEGYADTDEGRADWFQWVESNVARRVGSNKELSKAEAHVLIDVLESAQAQDGRR